MVEKKFYLNSKSGKLQRIGLRAQIVSFLIENGIEKGNALNDPSDRNKVIVAVSFTSNPPKAETEIKEIERIEKALVDHLNSLSALDEQCYHQMPSDITGSELHNLSNPRSITVMDLQKLSASLMLEQTSKGVGAMLFLTETLKPLTRLPESIDKLSTLPESINKMQASMDRLSALPASMDKLSRLPESIDKLRDAIARK
ncbi:MAG: hypothetical protein V1834_00495 [Candidatus Micrarchaeota archaeon]